MRSRSGIQGVASSPVIVGAVTVLVVIVAVFLAYNANNGLPFVSTYDLKARVPNATALVKGNEVRIGGSRIGVVKEVKPVQVGNGRVAAELSLSLDKGAEPIPADSTMIIRPKSPLGLKYLQIVPGDSPRGLKAGETIPLSAARPEPVDIDQFFDMFDEKTRKAIQRNNAGFGDAFAGRGPQINSALGSLRNLVEHGQPVLRTLVDPGTRFGAFWEALEALSATVAPVAEQQASMFVALDRTFAAFARVSRPYIQETIVKGPPTLDAVTADLPALRPFFRDSGRFFTALKPGANALGETSPTINAALRAGIPALNRSPRLYAQLTPTAEALLDFQEEPGVFNGLDLLMNTNEVLAPAIKYIAPAQVTCQYLSIAATNLANAFSESNGKANWLSAIAFEAPDGPNAESQPASAPANGPGNTNHLHFNPYPRTGQDGVCEAGNERYAAGETVIGHAAKLWGEKTRGEEG
ncbi:MAG TPA: MlaD family protein [Solirubrobacterales bacterium]|nr:MlaD family protein [Solirubrobacterales bacterium]